MTYPVKSIISLMVTVATALGQSSTSVDWQSVSRVNSGEVIRVVLARGEVIDGRLERWSSDSVVISGGKTITRTLTMKDVKQFLVRRKASRLKAVGIGAGIGFGVGFAAGASAAGSLTDRNNPSFGSRAQAGGGVGLVGAGIGALIGALAGGGSRYQTIYQTR